MAIWQEALTNPAKMMERQAQYWGQALTHYMEVQKELAKGHLTLHDAEDIPGDKRFSNPLWKDAPLFQLRQEPVSRLGRDDAAGRGRPRGADPA